MTITREDVHVLSRGPGPGGTPLSAAEADRVAAVLNSHTSSRPTGNPREEIQQAAAALPEEL